MSGSVVLPHARPTVLRLPTTTLDRYCERHSLRPQLIKIDVEAAELLVLRGAEGLMRALPDLVPFISSTSTAIGP